MIMVNLPSAGVEYHIPFGGMKDSSSGWREQGPAAIAVLHRDQDGLHEGPTALSPGSHVRLCPIGP